MKNYIETEIESNSKHSKELSDILVYAKRHNIPLIAITKNPQSALGKNATLVLKLPDNGEACPLGLAPTSSTTATLVLGDVLAIDLGGGYHPDTVFKVFYIWSSTFKPKHTVIRNRGILEFVKSSKTSGEEYSSSEGFLETYHDSGIPPLIKEFDLWTPSLKKE